MIKMFAGDLDGTLLNALHRGGRNHFAAPFSELTEAGLHVVPGDRTLDAADRRAWL